MELEITRTRRDRLRRRTVVAAVGVGLICGAYLLPRVAQAVTRKADPLSLKAAAKSTVSSKSSVVSTSFSGLKSATAAPLVLIPEKERRRTPHKPKPPKPPPYHREGPPPGLPFE